MKKRHIISVYIPLLVMFCVEFSRSDWKEHADGEGKYQSCTEPISWRIGRLDSLFDIEERVLKQIVVEAGRIWSDAAGRKLFAYSDSGEVAVNFIYSEEQKFTRDEQKLAEKISKMKLRYHAYNIEYQKLDHDYEAKIKDYNEALSNYEQYVKSYKRKMSRWSSMSVIPKEADDKLNDLRKRIGYWKTREEIELNALNTHIKKMQRLSAELNEYADSLNELIHHYNDKFTDWKTFHQGVYIKAGSQKKINVYQFEDLDKLRLLLAHELGHALGLKHVSNSKSVMYFQIGNQNIRDLKLSREDIKAIHERCRVSIN